MTFPLDNKAWIEALPQQPGVYVMFGDQGERLYVGKAKNLKNRLKHYYQCRLDAKTLTLMRQVVDIQVTVTSTETEAFLLEKNLVKTYQPKYNLDLKDDKSYPFLLLSTEEDFPRLSFYRHQGRQKPSGLLYGPYPNGKAVREALSQLQAVFRLRQCDPTFFKNRSRPCLQYHIQRCSAPCVGYIQPSDYQQSVENTKQFLSGKDQALMNRLADEMEKASLAQAYEKAALIRDQLIRLRALQARQYVVKQQGDIDVIGIAIQGGASCVQVLSIRGGKLLSSRPFFPKMNQFWESRELLETFLLQYYGEEDVRFSGELAPPATVLIKTTLAEVKALTELLTALRPQTRQPLHLQTAQRGDKAHWLQMATENAESALSQHLKQPEQWQTRFLALQTALDLPELPQKIDCFDVSHTLGEATIAACVSFTPQGADHKAYRHYALEDINPGDDYAALKEGLTRHYLNLKKQENPLPDVILIDGGKGQVTIAKTALAELQMEPFLIGVAKGVERKPGQETLFLGDKTTLDLSPRTPAFHLIQQIRDAAHRFAITRHRRRRDKRRLKSRWDEIPGIGLKRRQALLRHFGQVSAIENASVEDLARVPGISRRLADIIYRSLHLG